MTERISACVKAVREAKLDGLLLSHSANISYLTGFRPADGYLLLSACGDLVYITNFIFKAEAQKVKQWKAVVSSGDIFECVCQQARQLKLSHVGFEGRHLAFSEQKKIKDYLNSNAIDFSPVAQVVENLRAIKTKPELDLIRQAAKKSYQAFDYVREIHDESMSEKELCVEIDKFLRLKGDNELAFPTIVAAGSNSSYPHHIPGNSRLNKKSFLIDLGSKHYGYCADLTRVFFEDKIPSLLGRVYDIVRKAQDLAVAKIKDGVPAKEVDAAARDYITKKGYGKHFGHGLGHGVGLEVHEPPFLNTKTTEVLKQGMVVTVEPAVYLEGNFGVRIEDMVLVKKDKAEIIHG